MIYLITGTPGASKTLNSVKEICEDSAFSDRPIYYNNIKCLALDLDFLNSFEGFFYTYFLRTCTKDEVRFVQPFITAAHKDNRLVSKRELAFLSGKYSQYNYLENFVYWVDRLYPKARAAGLKRYLKGCEEFKYKPKLRHVKRFNLHWIHFNDPQEWYKLPAGSVIVVDEIQNFFPKRSSAKEAPEFIARFNTHRHHGFDLRLITQDSSLIDYQLKACVNRHIHYKNRFGGEKVSRFEHGQHMNVHSPSDLKASDRQKIITRDKKYYGSYWSAEMHTHTYSMPDYLKKLWIWIVIVMVFSYGIYWSIGHMYDSVIESTAGVSGSEVQKQNNLTNNNNNEQVVPHETSTTPNNCTVLSSGRQYCL